jgi:hypothetical protein
MTTIERNSSAFFNHTVDAIKRVLRPGDKIRKQFDLPPPSVALRTGSNHYSVISREAFPQAASFKRPTGQMLLIPAMVVCSSYFRKGIPIGDVFRRS